MPKSTDPFALVVDDDAIILMHAADILTEVGFRPLEAHDVNGAIETLENCGETVTLLFTDVEMPGPRDGFDLAREVADRWPDTEIVVASGRRTPAAGDMPAKATFIPKPFSADLVKRHLSDKLPDGKKPEPLKRAV